MTQQPQALLIGPVHVLEDQQQARRPRRFGQQLGEPHEHPKPDRGIRIDRLVRQHPIDVPNPTVHSAPPRPQRRGAGVVDGVAAQHRHAVPFGLARRSVGEATLADTSRTGQEQQATLAGPGLGQGSIDLGQFGRPADQRSLDLVLAVGVTRHDDEVHVHATAEFDRRVLGIRAPRFVIGRRIAVRIDAVLRRT
jgi:hypothetical protein